LKAGRDEPKLCFKGVCAMSRHPTIRQVLGETTWRFPQARPPEVGTERTVIAISRLPGARGGELARLLGRTLGLHVFDREIIQKIAEHAHLAEWAVSVLDERDRPVLRDWLLAFAPEQQLSSYGYRSHLTRVVTAIARLGRAVIVGRGANLILAPGEALRVLVVAPLVDRIAAVAAREDIGLAEAARRVAELESDRRAFLKHHFHADIADVTAFDLVVNTSQLGVEGAADAVRGALPRLRSGEAVAASAPAVGVP
jgi:cytidylate kinase